MAKEEMRNIKYKKRRFHLIVCSLITSLVFISSGLILICLRKIAYEKMKAEVFTLAPGSRLLDVFKKTPFDIYLDVYFFNWTNPEEFTDLDKKPMVKEIGPFRFLEVIEKTNITFHQNDTLSFNRTRRWYFVENESPYNLNTPITTINPVAVSAGYSLRHDGSFMKRAFSFSLSSIVGSLATTKSAGETFLHGYEDPLIQLAKKIPFVKKRLPPIDKFGWFYGRNNSNSFDGHFNMGTGSKNILGELYNWNYGTQTPYYEDTCGNIRGACAEFYPQNLGKGPLEIFNSEMCRTVLFDYVGETRTSLIKGYEYTAGDHFFDNGTKIPENICYCTGECVPYGMMNVSSCRYGAPGFVSLPHFYKADPYYNSLIDGLTPSDKHNFRIVIEPITGLPLEVAARLQMNLMVRKVPGISLMENINDVFFPVLWLEQVVRVPNSYACGLLALLWMKEVLLVIGIILIIAAVYILYCITYKICTTPLCDGGNNKELLIKELVPLNQEAVR